MLSEKIERLGKLLKGLRKKPENGHSYFDAVARKRMLVGSRFLDWPVGEMEVVEETDGRYLFLTATVNGGLAVNLVMWYLTNRGELVRATQTHERFGHGETTTISYDLVDMASIDEAVIDQITANVRNQLSCEIARKAAEIATYSAVLADNLH